MKILRKIFSKLNARHERIIVIFLGGVFGLIGILSGLEIADFKIPSIKDEFRWVSLGFGLLFFLLYLRLLDSKLHKNKSNQSSSPANSTRIGISGRRIFEEFYQDVFSHSSDSDKKIEMFMCGGSLFRVFQPKSYRAGSDIYDSPSCISDIESLNLEGHIWDYVNESNLDGLTFNILILSPFNPQVNTIEDFQIIYEQEKNSAKEDVYKTLFVIYLIAASNKKINFHIRLLLQDPMTYSAHFTSGQVLVVNYLLTGLSDGSPYYCLNERDPQENPLHEKYYENLSSYFARDQQQDRTIEVDLNEISLRNPTTLSEFKQEIDYLIKSGTYRSVHNPHHAKNILLSKYYEKVVAIRDGADVYPVQIEINICDTCNQACHWCISENIRNRPLKLAIDKHFKAFLAQFAAQGGEAVTWSGGGEPTQHPELLKAMEWVAGAGLRQGLITNGDYDGQLNEGIIRYCEWIRISVDTVSPNKYKKFRGRDSLSNVLDNIESLTQQNNIRVGINANISEWNKHEIKDIYEKANSLKADYVQFRPTLKTPFPHKKPFSELTQESLTEIENEVELINVGKGSTELILSLDKINDLQKAGAGDPYTQIIDYKGCMSHSLLPVLNCDGDLAVCMYHLFDPQYVFGNIYHDTFINIWEGKKRKDVVRFCKKKLDHKNNNCQICCKGHEINKVLLSASDPVELSGFETNNFL